MMGKTGIRVLLDVGSGNSTFCLHLFA